MMSVREWLGRKPHRFQPDQRIEATADIQLDDAKFVGVGARGTVSNLTYPYEDASVVVRWDFSPRLPYSVLAEQVRRISLLDQIAEEAAKK